MRQYVIEAFTVLNAHRARSLLTALGLVIGVMAVVAIQVLGSGMAGAVAGIFQGISDRSFTLFPNSRQADFTRARIMPEEIERAARAIPGVAEALPVAGIVLRVRSSGAGSRLSIGGESERRYFTAPIRYGHAFSAGDIASAAPLAVLSDDGYNKLFPDGGDPTGSSIRIGEHRYIVAGVLAKPRGGIAPLAVRTEVLLPYTTLQHDFLRGRPVFGARFNVTDDADLSEVERDTVEYFSALKKGHAIYQTFDRRSLTTAVDRIFGGLTLVVALIGATSLVVAGVGILNIMLVSVTERTREIGVRKAVGATRSQVLAQFFIEALMLSAVGCGIGLVLGLGIGYAIDRFALVAISGIVTPIPWLRAVAIATAFATLVTVVFGSYPAYRAASLDPVEALRYE